jgi:hypothetical protein
MRGMVRVVAEVVNENSGVVA